jgi:septum formation protein
MAIAGLERAVWQESWLSSKFQGIRKTRFSSVRIALLAFRCPVLSAKSLNFMNKPLILASSSPFRRQLLERLEIPFSVKSPEIDESPRQGERPRELVVRLAVEKAQAVATNHPGTLVIGSDQVALHGQEIVGKPADRDEAIRQLESASGKSITLLTGLALVESDSGRVQSSVVPFKVYFRDLNREVIERYLDREQPYQCCGSLKSEALGIALIEKMEGDDPNALIGLPLIELVNMLTAEGYTIP